MGLNKLIGFVSLVALLVVFPPLISLGAAASAGDGDLRVFTEVSPDSLLRGDSVSPVDPTERRSRHVMVDFDLFGGAQGIPPKGRGVGQRVELNLFADTMETAVFKRVEENLSGGRNWIGNLEGVDLSTVVLVFHNGVLTGKVASPRGIYQIQGKGGGVHKIVEIDQSKFPDELPPVAVDLGSSNLPAADVSASSPDDGSNIDVIVFYTPEARAAGGGTAAMESLVALAVAETNASYENSGISQRVNLVSVGEIIGASNDWGTDLYALQDPADLVMDDVPVERDNKHADHVVLIIENSASCGLGYFMDTVSTWNASYAYVVVGRTCATGYFSFGHELGHNMSATHDWYVDSGTSPYTYIHGYVNTSDRWRTVMAYNDECVAVGGFNCTRLPYWSNPEVIYNSDPMGVSGGTKSDCLLNTTYLPGNQCDADNRLTLNSTAPTTAQFRASRITWDGTDSTSWSTANNWVQAQGNPWATTGVALTPRIIDSVVVPSAPTGGRFPTLSTPDTTVRSLLIEGGGVGGLEIDASGSLVITVGGTVPCDVCV